MISFIWCSKPNKSNYILRHTLSGKIAKKSKEKITIKVTIALTGVAQWVGCRPVNLKVTC